MTRRSARFLTRLYPPRWRDRYGEEFQTFLESRHVRPREILNTIGSAISERAAGSLTVLLYTCLAFVAPGGAWYLAASGAPLARMIETHPAFWLLWGMIQAGSLAIAAAGVLTVAPVLFRLRGFRIRGRRRDVLWRLAWPAFMALLLALELVAYVEMPESGLGDAGCALVMFGAFVDAVSRFFRYVIGHSRLSRSLGRVKRSVLAMASWIIVASAVAAGYCLQIRFSTGSAFWYRTGALVWLIAMTFRALTLRREFRPIH